MRSFLFIIISLWTVGNLYAQAPSGRVYGTVIDEVSNEPLEFATVILKNIQTNATLGGLTDERGRINVENVRFGKYSLEISYLGYDNYIKDEIVINSSQSSINLGRIKMNESAAMLEAVEVVGEKRMFQLGGEKKIFNVEKSAISSGGNAVDAMKQIPLLDVGMEGNISLRGSENILIYINGKPSGMTGESQEAILESLPADGIESIELITNPSSKYDADGTAGIINIVLKKNYNRSLNGVATVGYATKYKHNAGVTLNFKKNRVNFTSAFNYRFRESYNKGESSRKNIFTETNYLLNDRESSYHTYNGSVNLGLDVDVTEKATLSLFNVLTAGGGPNEELNLTSFLDANQIYYGGYERTRDGERTNFNNNSTLSYQQRFNRPRQVLDMSAMYERGRFVRPKHFTQINFDADENPIDVIAIQEFNENKSHSTSAIYQTDYAHPFSKHGELEAGFKISYRNINSDFYADSLNRATQQTEVDTDLTNNFDYKENVNAAYIAFGGKAKNFNYKLGVRMEQTNVFVENDQIEEEFRNSYVHFFPSAFLSQRFAESHEMQLSYTRRINRPNPWMLNPFTDYDDPLNIREGNPYLGPELIDAVELTYLKNWDATFLTASVYYRHTASSFSRIRTVDPETAVATMTWANIDKSQDIGGEVILRTPITRWWNIMGNANLFYKSVQGTIPGEDVDNSADNFQWNARVMSNFTFWKGTELQLSYRYNSKMVFLQGHINPMHSLDIGIKKDFLNKKATLSMNVQDLFNTRVFKVYNSASTFESDMKWKWETRVFAINFSYKFGRGESRPKRRTPGDMMGGEDMMGF